MKEIESIIITIDAQKYKTKKSREKTIMDRLLYNPKQLNKAYDEAFQKLNWHKQKISCDYSKDQYVTDYKSESMHNGAFREIDFVKEKLGVEIQFGKYAFMVYNVCAKMTIFDQVNLGHWVISA